MKMNVTKIWSIPQEKNHNAFTDLTWYQGDIYLTYRSCPQGHALYTSSRVVVLRSRDEGQTWEKVFCAGVPGRDVRDPHFLQLSGGLAVYSGTWPVDPNDPRPTDYHNIESYVAFSEDGLNWRGFELLPDTRGIYCWRTGSWGGRYYMCGKNYREIPERRHSKLLASDDGFTWREEATIMPNIGDETSFIFAEDGEITALVRTSGPFGSYVCRAKRPYAEWERWELPEKICGPLLFAWGGELYAAGRSRVNPAAPVTRIYRLKSGLEGGVGGGWELEELHTLPSAGDNSYPGFIELAPGRGLFSYYSSHEEHTKVYLAELTLD